ncbi:MAG: DUF262 domain-containing protein [Hahellaceae bacterium]|nr:DUF262 domain-containing protein [Hahellaceae bacterium]
MSVIVATCTARELFEKKTIQSSEGKEIKGKLTIPEYQRPYCWQDKQIDDLLRDFRVHFERDAELPYYLGSLILHQTEEQLNIIDGQQRISTLAILGLISEQVQEISLEYTSSISHQQILKNIERLRSGLSQWKNWVDFNRIQFTLVVTQSEDDAYRFFETQNTGGVRLAGPDIIKAHHLRAVPKVHQTNSARQWERLGDLNSVVMALLKGRYWQRIQPRNVPSHRQPKPIRDCIVSEFGENTDIGDDVSFIRIRSISSPCGDLRNAIFQQGYDVRQPINAGLNCVNYLAYFQKLRDKYWKNLELPHIKGYVDFCISLRELEGCGYLQDLFETCLLMYISQFGEYKLESAAKKLFRVVYSRRVTNQKSVRESSIPAFINDNPVLDWIALSYTPQQCFSYLDAFKLTVDPNNIRDTKSVKARFMKDVNNIFDLQIKDGHFDSQFGPALTNKIVALGGPCDE